MTTLVNEIDGKNYGGRAMRYSGGPPLPVECDFQYVQTTNSTGVYLKFGTVELTGQLSLSYATFDHILYR